MRFRRLSYLVLWIIVTHKLYCLSAQQTVVGPRFIFVNKILDVEAESHSTVAWGPKRYWHFTTAHMCRGNCGVVVVVGGVVAAGVVVGLVVVDAVVGVPPVLPVVVVGVAGAASPAGMAEPSTTLFSRACLQYVKFRM